MGPMCFAALLINVLAVCWLCWLQVCGFLPDVQTSKPFRTMWPGSGMPSRSLCTSALAPELLLVWPCWLCTVISHC